ncbi:glycosyl hydrolase [Mucilaginibacter myungsuensis]|uniref:Mannan endo-1,4-beta-mannosidase A and B n=1 Tax=Mucilaginibacter myungsuensis TaxID=649104 RepID=A0A929L175_9SPHI|nr:glycosyl hydrolase [Mucilaginibacter myungsuensis]MBE9662235.1 mannan endo-1,4-beta-mannosidase A and B [Mucilaginibacter myungsuensis]MDN3599329.1 glycosyl hydrolase [Mucilaginibacter myungsuensis]
MFAIDHSYGQARLSLSNKNASAEAKAVYAYLQDMYGKKMLAGQMTSNWGFDELKYVLDSTGKLPAIRGLDFVDSAKNNNEVKFAKAWWKQGGIPTIMWHWGAPAIGSGYENSKKEIDIDKIFQQGTPEHTAFWKELKEKAQLLKKLKRAKVPVLWRPFHELNGNWFWWGKQGPDRFKRLWITMYNYYVHDQHLDNLIWVHCYMDKPDAAWYPGREYVDIAGPDTYQPGLSRKGMYEQTRAIVGDTMPIAFHECGIPPDPAKSFAEGSKWSWFMQWHTDHLKKVPAAHLKYVYDHDLVVTLDKVPNIKKAYRERRPNIFERVKIALDNLVTVLL